MSILPDLRSRDLSTLSQAELIAMVHTMQAAKATRITYKVTEKGGLSVYGLGRFPVTLYASQWRRLFSEAEAIQGFMAANASKLTEKA